MAMISAWTHSATDVAREALAAQLGQVLARRDSELGRQALDQHGHQHHPQQQVAEL
jgi:hypothetical protein